MLDGGRNLGYTPPVTVRFLFLSTLLVLGAALSPSLSLGLEENDAEELPEGLPDTTEDSSPSLAPASPPMDPPVVTVAPVVTASEEDSADVAEAALKRALERLAAVDLSTSRGELDPSREGLVAIRAELLDVLVALGQLRQDRDSRVWLEENGYGVLKIQAPLDGGSAEGAEDPGKETGPLLASEVDALKRSIEGAPFNEGKLQLLQEGIDGRTLTAVQAEGLLELFSFSRDRVDVLVFLHPKLEPEEDFWRLLLALKFESDRQAVRDRIGQES